MGGPGETAERIKALQALLDRLCAPDLTLSEAKGVRAGLAALLGGAAGDPIRERSEAAAWYPGDGAAAACSESACSETAVL